MGMCKAMASGTFEWPEKAQNGLGWLQKYFIQYYMKRSFIHFYGLVVSLGSVRLHIMCVETIAGQKWI